MNSLSLSPLHPSLLLPSPLSPSLLLPLPTLSRSEKHHRPWSACWWFHSSWIIHLLAIQTLIGVDSVNVAVFPRLCTDSRCHNLCRYLPLWSRGEPTNFQPNPVEYSARGAASDWLVQSDPGGRPSVHRGCTALLPRSFKVGY